jgi:ABC-type transport system substrate-binding protein
VWQFKIRGGVFFHEDECFGSSKTRELTAEDVLYSFQRVVSKESYPSFVLADIVKGVSDFQAGRTTNVAGFRLAGPNTFEIELSQPEAFFLHRLTSPWFGVYPREAVNLGPDVFGRTKAIGTGPFRLRQRSDTEVVLDKNQRYWRAVNGNVDDLRFRVIKNEQIRLSELRNGNISMMRLPVSLIPGVLAHPDSGLAPREPFDRDFYVSAFPTFNSHFIGFNCDKMDVHIRRAISLALDRREIIRAITNDSAILATGTVPKGLLGYAPPYEGDIFNLGLAKEELAKSRLDPKSLTIELLVHEKDNTDVLGQLVQSQLQKIGLKVTLTRLDYNTVVDRMIKGNTQAFALAFEYVFSAPQPILINIFDSAKIPVPNFWHYNNAAVDKQLENLRHIDDQIEANVASRALEKQIIDDAPAAFLYQSQNLVIYRKEVSGLAFNGHGVPLLWEVRVGTR